MPRRPRPKAVAVRGDYEAHGVRPYYEAVRGGRRTYRNPHEACVHRALALAAGRWSLELGSVLDLAAGSGEVTRGLLKLRQAGRAVGSIEAVDPYTFDLYRRRTGLAASAISFEQIAQGGLADRRYSLVICSYALHLVEPSRLPVLMQQLAMIGAGLLVLTPNRRPEIAPTWGWIEAGRMAVEKTKARFYRSGSEGA